MNSVKTGMRTVQGNFRVKHREPITVAHSSAQLKELFLRAGFTYNKITMMGETIQNNKKISIRLGLPFIDGLLSLNIVDFLNHTTVRECSLEMCTGTTKLTEYQARWLLSYIMQVLAEDEAYSKDFDVYLQYMLENRPNKSKDVNWFD